VLGHEFVGIVDEVGSGVTDLHVGDLVAPDTLIHCGECFWCLRHQVHRCEKLAILGLMTDGGLAEFVNLPQYMCYRLPKDIDNALGALAEPTSVAIRAYRRARTSFGESVVIVGAGTIGLLFLQVARLSGASCTYVIEPESSRRAVARRLGATDALDPGEVNPVEIVNDYTGGLGADVVIEAGGNEKIVVLAPQLARKGGRVVFLGQHNLLAPFDFFPVVVKELELIGSFSHIYDEDFASAVSLIGDGRIDAGPLIASRIPLADSVSRGLEELIEAKSVKLKIFVSPHLV